MTLKIHKKYLDKIEQYTKYGYGGRYNPYAVRYVFNLPEGTMYENYAVMIDTEDKKYNNNVLVVESVGANELKGNYYYLKLEDSEKFSLTRYKNRENGKKYKRYELTAQELNSIYNYNRDFSSMQVVVAEVVQYLNNGTREARSVLSKNIKVGYSDGTWLYVDSEKRRINSKGIEIISGIKSENKEKAEKLIQDYYTQSHKISNEICDKRDELRNLDSICAYAERLSSSETSKEIIEICKREKKVIEKDIESFENSIEKRDDLLSTLLHLG